MATRMTRARARRLRPSHSDRLRSSRRAQAEWVRTLLTALRDLWDSARRRLATTLGSHGLTGVVGAACLAIDCVTLGSMFLA